MQAHCCWVKVHAWLLHLSHKQVLVVDGAQCTRVAQLLILPLWRVQRPSMELSNAEPVIFIWLSNAKLYRGWSALYGHSSFRAVLHHASDCCLMQLCKFASLVGWPPPCILMRMYIFRYPTLLLRLCWLLHITYIAERLDDLLIAALNKSALWSLAWF